MLLLCGEQPLLLISSCIVRSEANDLNLVSGGGVVSRKHVFKKLAFTLQELVIIYAAKRFLCETVMKCHGRVSP